MEMMMDECENDLIRAAAALAHKMLDEMACWAIEGNETDSVMSELKDVIDVIHAAKQRKVGLR